MKSRTNWLLEGERNTKFFHLTTIVQRKRNRITGLRNEVGEWITDFPSLKHHITSFFTTLYSRERETSDLEGILSNTNLRTLQEEARSELMKPVTPQEIRAALKSLKPKKSLGPDGLHPLFFQKYFHIVGESLIEFVQDIFNGGKFPEGANDTLLALIPKCQFPETISQFRPISLCNTSYKVITKILVRRMRPFVDDFFSPFQSSFIPGR